jgi:hypothetical protein
LQSEKRKGNYLFSGNGGADMRTTILAYVIAVLGFVMICGGVYSFFDLWNARAPLRHYAITIGMICGVVVVAIDDDQIDCGVGG